MYSDFLKRIISSVVLIPVIIFVIVKGSFFFNFFLILCYLISIFEWKNFKVKKNILFYGYLFITFSFISAYNLRFSFDNNYIYFFLSLFICVFTDIGGYVFGKVIKGPKLIKISPNKTYSGLMGSYLLPIIVFFILSDYHFVQKTLIIKFDVVIYLIIVISTFSQLGDLLISYFKRLSNIKDTGRIIPGHGGLLDRIDGMLIAFPLTNLILTLDIFNIIK